jgi:hypothetical protein
MGFGLQGLPLAPQLRGFAICALHKRPARATILASTHGAQARGSPDPDFFFELAFSSFSVLQKFKPSAEVFAA